MIWQPRDMREVIANRKQFRAKRIIRQKFRKNKGDVEDNQQIKPQILKKTEFTLEDKQEIVKYVQNKGRIYFRQFFNMNQFQLISVKQSTILQEEYNPLARSYYLISGRINISFFTSLITQNENQQKSNMNATITSQYGLGWVFDNQNYSNAQMSIQNGIVLKINHKNQSSFDLIQKKCIMTNRERQLGMKKFKIFSSILNFNKLFLPYFNLKKYTKGQYIYLINDEPKEIFLVIQGMVAFQSLVDVQPGEEQIDIRRGPLFLKRNRKENILLITQTVCKNNYFGQEEIISQTNRQQNAKCVSIQCLVMIVPYDKLQKLLSNPQFKHSLNLSSKLKQAARQHQINLYQKVNSKKSDSQTINPQNEQKFQRIKSVIFNQLSNHQQKSQIRSKYSNEKRKIIHNLSVNIPHEEKERGKITNFSMLNVNKSMYQKTLLRFRYNLKQLQKAAQPKQKGFENRGRSLQQIWRTLKLQKSFDPEQERIILEQDDGLTYYNTHQKLCKQIKISRCFRPKSLIYTNKLKTQYIQYLQMIL